MSGAPTIPLIISTCVDSPLEATLPPNLHYWNPKGLRQVERSSLSEMDCGLPGPSAIPHKPSSHFPLLSAHPSQHACPVVDGICRSSCLALFLWASLFLHPWPCLSTCLGKERYWIWIPPEKRNYLALTSKNPTQKSSWHKEVLQDKSVDIWYSFFSFWLTSLCMTLTSFCACCIPDLDSSTIFCS